MLRLKSWAVLVALGGCLAMTGMPQAAGAAVCDKSTPTCTVTVTTSVWTGDPTIICVGDVIRVQFSYQCAGCSGSESVLRCANSSEGFRVTGNGCNFNIRLSPGHTWGEALTDCTIIKI